MALQKIHIVITAASGQLGQALKKEGRGFENLSFTFLDKKDLDITDKKAVHTLLSSLAPEVIINTAAYTAVDAAEDNKEAAYAVNEVGVYNLATYCKGADCGLIHLSTDYVFDGSKRLAYTEEDSTNPQTVYGKSKRAGELAIIEAGLSRYAIIRTSWLYSHYASNYVKTMLRLSQVNKEIAVVNDQFGSPTYANDLAQACLQIATQLDTHNAGLYHYSNGGETSWFAFAKALFSHINRDVRLTPLASKDYITKAQRPLYTALDTNKIAEVFQVQISQWEDSLRLMLTQHTQETF